MKHLLLTTIAAVLLVGCGDSKKQQDAICWNNSKQIALALLMFANDHDGKLPWQLSEKDGGSMEFIRPRSDKNALLAASGEPIFDENAWRHFLALGPYLGNTLKKSFICPTSGKKANGEVSSSDDVSYWLLTDEKLNLNNVKNPRDAFFSVCPHHPNKSYIASTADGNALTVHWPKMRQNIIKGLLINGDEDSQQQPSKTKVREISILDAVKGGNIAAVKQHISTGTDVNVKNELGMTPLFLATGMGHKEIAELLISKGADLNVKDKNGGTPLHIASSRGQKEIAQLLIASDAEVNAMILSGSYKGITPLDFATKFNHPEIADLIRKHGGKTSDWLKAEDSIQIAAKAGHIEAVKKHLADGTDVNAIGEFRKASPLYMAAYSYNAEATKFLLENGADVHQLDFEKETALHTAAYHSYHGEGDLSVVTLLVDHGSKINAISDRGLTPLDLAIMAGTPEVSDLLRRHGAKTAKELKAEGK